MTGKSKEKLPRIIVSSPRFREDLRGNVVFLSRGRVTESELEVVIDRLEASGEEFKPFALIEGEIVDIPETLLEFTSKKPEEILKDQPEAKVSELELRIIPVEWSRERDTA